MNYNDNTTPIIVNGTTFRIYSDPNYPLNSVDNSPRDYCTPVSGTSRGDATSCSYLGNDYCCGTWNVDAWYKADISNRLTTISGNAWYAESYFNQYSGYHCQVRPDMYEAPANTMRYESTYANDGQFYDSSYYDNINR